MREGTVCERVGEIYRKRRACRPKQTLSPRTIIHANHRQKMRPHISVTQTVLGCAVGAC
jgi:hypothetical protein